MTIIYITQDTLIAPESSFTWDGSSTVMDTLVLPRTAGRILAIRAGVAVKAIHHKRSRTYGFVWNSHPYRAFADLPGAPVVLTDIEQSDHWQTCKACREGAWCDVGTALIQGAMQESEGNN